MTYPWRKATDMARRFVESHQQRDLLAGNLNGNVIVARAEEGAKSGKLSPEDATSVALGVTFSVLGLALIGLSIWFFVFKPRRQQKLKTDVDVEAGTRSWWMVTDIKGDGEKGGSLAEWWRKSYAVPDRVEPPPTPATAGARTSLQRFRSILTRKGALRGIHKNPAGDEESQPPVVKSMIPSPTLTIDIPIQAVPQTKPRYPSVLERGYRVPLYPTITPPKDLAGSRSLTSPGDVLNGSTATVTTPGRPPRTIIGLPPRSLKASNGRLLNPIAEHRKSGQPRSPAHRRRVGFNVNIGQFKHPFIPLKDSDTDFPTISGPLPSAETSETNPKLGYPVPMPRMRTAVPGPRVNVARANSRRVPAPVSIQTAPLRPLVPATPLHFREETRVLPPGQSAGLTRPAPTPI